MAIIKVIIEKANPNQRMNFPLDSFIKRTNILPKKGVNNKYVSIKFVFIL